VEDEADELLGIDEGIVVEAGTANGGGDHRVETQTLGGPGMEVVWRARACLWQGLCVQCDSEGVFVVECIYTVVEYTLL